MGRRMKRMRRKADKKNQEEQEEKEEEEEEEAEEEWACGARTSRSLACKRSSHQINTLVCCHTLRSCIVLSTMIRSAMQTIARSSASCPPEHRCADKQERMGSLHVVESD